jgi:hypothetical protein
MRKTIAFVAILVLIVAASFGFAWTKGGSHEIARISNKAAAIENGILNNLK